MPESDSVEENSTALMKESFTVLLDGNDIVLLKGEPSFFDNLCSWDRCFIDLVVVVGVIGVTEVTCPPILVTLLPVVI